MNFKLFVKFRIGTYLCVSACTNLKYVVSQSGVYSAATGAATYEMLTNDKADSTKGSWGSGSTSNSWLLATFTNAVTVDRVTLGGGAVPGWGNAEDYYNGFNLQFSNDNKAWTTVKIISKAKGFTMLASKLLEVDIAKKESGKCRFEDFYFFSEKGNLICNNPEIS